MTWKPVSVKLPALALSAVLALSLAPAFGLDQADAPVSGIPYSREVQPEIAKLKSAPVMPRSVDDLKAIQDRVEAVVKYALPATVGIRIFSGMGEVEEGSGIIVSKSGYVLTAGHVSGKPGTKVQLILSNGRVVDGVSLGANTQIDSGMVKITPAADYPYVPLGSASKLVQGQWVVALGHPGGYQRARPPVVRIGRVLNDPAKAKDFSRGRTPYIQTDCELIMGDSGGPVFDLDGRLIGINSRIGLQAESNVHVPIDTYTETWDRLANSERWGSTGLFSGGGNEHVNSQAIAPTPAKPAIGALPNETAQGVELDFVRAGMAAEKAGLAEGDIITKFDGQVVKSIDQLSGLLAKHRVGDKVNVEYLRQDKTAQTTLTLDAQITP